MSDNIETIEDENQANYSMNDMLDLDQSTISDDYTDNTEMKANLESPKIRIIIARTPLHKKMKNYISKLLYKFRRFWYRERLFRVISFAIMIVALFGVVFGSSMSRTADDIPLSGDENPELTVQEQMDNNSDNKQDENEDINLPETLNLTPNPTTNALELVSEIPLPVPRIVPGIRKNSLIADHLKIDISDFFEGSELEISVIDLTEGIEDMNIDGDKMVVSASTYKIYVAYSMLKSIQNGTSWDYPLAGTTLNICFSKMIIYSDNDCAETWMNEKPSRFLTDIEDLKLKNTLRDGEAFHTSANDLASTLKMLYRGEILTEALRTKWINTMEKQIYREGLPAGLKDIGVVADKVGFLGGYLNDAGICYTQKGDFIIVILTNDSSWKQISQISEAIYEKL